MPGTNTLAYLASSLAKKEKGFITLTPGANGITHFFLLDDEAKAARVLVPAKYIQANLTL